MFAAHFLSMHVTLLYVSQGEKRTRYQMEEKVSEELRLKREIDQMRKDIELLQVALVLQAKQTEFEILTLSVFQAAKTGFQRDVEKLTAEKNDLTARLELFHNHIKSYQHHARDLQ